MSRYPYDAIVVLGPTASGKTQFAVELAKKYGGEILSADSRQVYKRMDIGTGKDLTDYLTNNTPYHLIDIVEPGTKYNLFEYQKDFSEAYKQVCEHGNLPIICGGTGLYIQAVTTAYNLIDVNPNEELRAQLEQKSMEELISMLKELKLKHGIKPHNNTDFDSKKRVIRAIEIEQEYDNKDEKIQSSISDIGRTLPQKVLYLGIEVDRETRNARIDRRLVERLNEGMVEEIKGLLDSGINANDLIYYGLEYKFVTKYIIGELTYQQMRDNLAIAIHQFAKRQMTWFRGMERKGIKIWWSKDKILFHNNIDNFTKNISNLIELQ